MKKLTVTFVIHVEDKMSEGHKEDMVRAMRSAAEQFYKLDHVESVNKTEVKSKYKG